MRLRDILTMRFENERLKKQVIGVGVTYILYFPQAFSNPQRVAEMYDERNNIHQPLRIEDYMPKDKELKDAA